MTRWLSTPESFKNSSTRTPKIVPVAPVIPTITFMLLNIRPTLSNSTPFGQTICMFTKVRVGRVSEEVVKQVQEAIFSGELKPGDRLPPERELAEQFGLSRMSVRDALRTLESSGLVKIKVGSSGGAFIREPNF